jgi:hypothetical protein
MTRDTTIDHCGSKDVWMYCTVGVLPQPQQENAEGTVVSDVYVYHPTLSTRVPNLCLLVGPEPVFVNFLRSLGIYSQPGGPVRQPYLPIRARQSPNF